MSLGLSLASCLVSISPKNSCLNASSGVLGFIYWTLNALHLSIHLREVCVFLAPFFSGLTAIATYLLTSELKDQRAGLFAAAFVAIGTSLRAPFHSVFMWFSWGLFAIVLSLTVFLTLWGNVQRRGTFQGRLLGLTTTKALPSLH